MIQAIVLAIVAHVSWATGNLFNVKLSRTITPFQTVFWQAFLLAFLLIPIMTIEPVSLKFNYVVLTGILAIMLYGGSLAFYTALRTGSAQIAGAITATVPAFVAILSIVFLHSKVSSTALIIIVFITIGLITVAWPKKHSRLDSGVMYAIVAVLLWAIYFTFISKSTAKLGPYWANYISVLSGVIVLLVYALVRKRNANFKIKIGSQHILFVAVSALFVGGAPLAYNIALEHASPAIVAPIAGSYAALFILVSSFIFKDEISKRQWTGIAITILSVLFFVLVNN